MAPSQQPVGADKHTGEGDPSHSGARKFFHSSTAPLAWGRPRDFSAGAAPAPVFLSTLFILETPKKVKGFFENVKICA